MISNNGDLVIFEYNAYKNEELQVEYSFDSTVVRWIYDDYGRVLKEYCDNNFNSFLQTLLLLVFYAVANN